LDNLRFYNQGRTVPANAQKKFSNGRFSGTDINPMWRIKKLTEMFGPAGIGWYTETTRQEVIPADDGNVMVFVDINLYVKDGDAWSKPIFGTGGNTLKVKGKGDDDGFKKAYTDALSIACKALGIGADIWYSADTNVNADYSSKYASMYTDAEKAAYAPSAPAPVPESPKPAKPADRPVSGGQMATDEQKAYIRSKSSDADYMDIMSEFGADLENLSEADARRVIGEIDRNNTAAPTCTRCHNAVTDAVLPDGSTMTAAEVIGKSKATYGAVYCWNCAKALKRASRKRETENGAR